MDYRKKPVVIQALQFNDTAESIEELVKFVCDDINIDYGTKPPTLKIATLEGVMEAKVGDYIIRGVNGEFYPCKPDIFEKTYDLECVGTQPEARYKAVKLNRIQKRENLNTVNVIDEIGNGGANHEYEILVNGTTKYVALEFQNGARKLPDSVHGIIDQDLLEIVRHRLQGFHSGPLATRETAMALTHLEEALMWLNRRTEDRIERDVLGTNGE